MRTELTAPTGCVADPAALLDELFPPFSYAVRASAVLNETSSAVWRYPSARSREDFLEAVTMLASASASQGRPSLPPRREIRDVWTTLVRCPLQTWEKIFGEPEGVMLLKHQAMFPRLHVWRYPCTDGAVRCIGHLLDRRHGPWILVVRICCF